jgi:hypothetical protein
MVDDCYYKPNSTEPNYIDLSTIQKVNGELTDELNDMAVSIKQTGQITPPMAQMRAWMLLDEFVSAMVYLHEIRQEHRIATGKMTAEEAIKEFQRQRSQTLLEQIEVVKDLLQK